MLAALVVFAAQADLSGAAQLASRAEKSRFVYGRLRDTATATQGPLQAWLEAQGISFRPFYLLNAISLDSVSESALETIAARPEVKIVIPNQLSRLPIPIAGPLAPFGRDAVSGPEPGIMRTGAPQVWASSGARGQGVVVGGNDTGVLWNHPALITHYRGYTTASGSIPSSVDHSFSWHDATHGPLKTGTNSCGFDTTAPCDDLGHGTHTMGTMVGDDGQGNQIGMAPEAKWIACRSMDRGSGTPAMYLECFEFFFAPYPQGHDPLVEGRPDLGADIIANSWGCAESEGCIAEDFQPAFDALAAAGELIVAAVGNSGPACSTASDEIGRFGGATLAVGAVDPATGETASFSSRGPLPGGASAPDLLAPGVNVRSSTFDGGYSTPGWSGTSMAAPHAAGAAALLLSARPDLSGQPESLAAALRNAARPVADSANCGGLTTASIPNDASGFGELDVFGALQKVMPTSSAEAGSAEAGTARDSRRDR